MHDRQLHDEEVLPLSFTEPYGGASPESVTRECYCTILHHDGIPCLVEVCEPCNRRLVRRAESFLS